MIIKRPKPGTRNGDEAMLPMINIVFLLLIFFMIAGALQSMDALDVSPPSSSTEQGGHLDNSRVVVSASGELALGSEIFTLDELPRVLQRHNLTDNIQIKADGQLTSAKLHALMTALRNAGVTKIRLTGERR